MCGIAGIHSLELDEPKRNELVKKMIKILSHRGKDTAPVLDLKRCSLAHTRLSIVGDSECTQPLTYMNVSVTYNGEIYNYLDLRTDLIRKGHRFKTKGDAEVVVAAYIEYGELFLQKLEGMFAFALYDINSDKLLLCRDRIGIKPLYYFEDRFSIAFASEIKAITNVIGNKSWNLDHESLCEYLHFQYCLDDSTLFDGIKKVRPGTFVCIGGKDGGISDFRYWDIGNGVVKKSNVKYYTESFYEDRLLSLLHGSLRSHVPANIDFGTYVSGGLDSSTVASLSSEYSNSFRMVTGKYDVDGFDESNYVNLLKDYLGKGVGLDVFSITEEDAVSTLEDAIYYMDEPCAGPGLIGQFVTAKKLREKYSNMKVMIGGQGGDELFGGYSRYIVAYLESCLRGAMYPNKKDYVLNLSRIGDLMPMLQGYEPMLKEFFSKGMFKSRESRYFSLISRFSDNCLNDDFKSVYNTHHEEIFDKYLSLFNSLGSVSYFTRMMYFDFKASLPALLHVDDRVNGAFELESRVPLLSTDIVEFAFGMPPEIKLSGGKSKGIIRKAVAGILPDEILNRNDKMGFPVPIQNWLDKKGKFYELVNDYVNNDNEFLNKVFSSFDTSKFNRELWGKLCLGIWSKKFNITF